MSDQVEHIMDSARTHEHVTLFIGMLPIEIIAVHSTKHTLYFASWSRINTAICKTTAHAHSTHTEELWDRLLANKQKIAIVCHRFVFLIEKPKQIFFIYILSVYYYSYVNNATVSRTFLSKNKYIMCCRVGKKFVYICDQQQACVNIIAATSFPKPKLTLNWTVFFNTVYPTGLPDPSNSV